MIFASLAARYANVLAGLAKLTGHKFQQIIMLGGGSRNELLRKLTADSTGLPVLIGEAEGSSLGNFAIQLAAGELDASGKLSPQAICRWAAILSNQAGNSQRA